MNNSRIASIFSQIADLLEIQDENPFRIRSYRRAAQAIESCAEDLASWALHRGDQPLHLPGIGSGMSQKIREIATEGRCREHQDLLGRLPSGLLDFLRVPGLGPRKTGLIYRELGISTLAQLERAAREGKLQALPGMGAKSESKILRGIEDLKKVAGRVLWIEAEQEIQEIRTRMTACPEIQTLEVAGSFRRRRDTVGDIDILAIGSIAEPVMETFCSLPAVKEVLARGTTRSSIRLESGLQVDLRLVPPESFPAALQYFTGSQAHNVALRERAKRSGYKINEYGLFREPEDAPCPIAGEEDLYRICGMDWIPPELRENRGELEASAAGRLPKLVEWQDIRGDLHNHTRDSDGACTMEELALWADCRGYEYLAITDHSKSLTVAHGLDERRLLRQMEEIDRWNARADKPFRVRLLKGCEVDIKADGSLDLDPEVLSRLDLVIASVHSHMSMPRDEMTERIVRAMSYGCVHLLAHPTGRILLQREPFDLDMEKIFGAALRWGVALELNAFPARLDLDDIHCRMAKEKGVKVAINSDTHAAEHFHFLRYGVFQARRGWLEKGDVLNTQSLDELRATLRQGKRIPAGLA